jgi:hypothetical protein
MKDRSTAFYELSVFDTAKHAESMATSCAPFNEVSPDTPEILNYLWQISSNGSKGGGKNGLSTWCAIELDL